MFSGIIETQGKVLNAKTEGQGELGLVRIEVERPADFNDIRIGDSIASNGICLTVEKFDDSKMTFALGAETLKITGWTADKLQSQPLNLERSLRFGDRMHGHMVSGHVDAVGEVVSVEDAGGSLNIDILAPEKIANFIWKKGSWAVNGVSLTVNDVQDATGGKKVSVCLIPETLKRTNLGELKKGARVNLEVDMMARGLVQFLETTGALEMLKQKDSGKN